MLWWVRFISEMGDSHPPGGNLSPNNSSPRMAFVNQASFIEDLVNALLFIQLVFSPGLKLI